MNEIWRDYRPDTMEYVESWLDESAVKATGLSDGFRDFYEYWAEEDGSIVGENFWCKVVFQEETPFAVIAFCRDEQTASIMELVVAPEYRGQGRGTQLLKALLAQEELIGCAIKYWEAVIYPDNIASQKAFARAGFQHVRTIEDQNGVSMLYRYERDAENT